MLGVTQLAQSKYQGADVVITGGLGFIGSNLARALVEGGAEVTIIDAELDEYGANRFNISGIRDDVNLVIGDIRDAETVGGAVKDADWVFHLAAQLSRTLSMRNPVNDIEINCIGSMNVLDGVRKYAPDATVVYTGSQASFGITDDKPITEGSDTLPVDIYGVNKLAAENYFRTYNRAHGITTKTMRLTNVYGPRAQLRNSNYGVINKFIRLALADETLTVYEPGTMKRDPVYIGDVVDALLRIGPSGDSMTPYVIGSGSSVSIKQLAKVIVNAAGRGRVKLTEWPDDWDSIQVGDISVNNEQAQSDLGWTPSVRLEQGIEQTISFYKEHKEEY